MPTPIPTLTPLGPYSNDEYIEALINYIASTPENINANILREMLINITSEPQSSPIEINNPIT